MTTKFKVLFLDDMDEREESFRKKFEDRFEITRVKDYDEFTDLMYELEDYDILFLDHDLSTDSILCDPETYREEKTGTDVADWLGGFFYEKEQKPKVVLHSMNPAGRRSMNLILLEAGFDVRVVPFFQLINWIK